MDEIQKDGLKAELLFWKAWLGSGAGTRYLHPDGMRFISKDMIGAKKEVTVANLGSGPINLLGNSFEDVKVDVISSDILADEYNKLLEELKIKSPHIEKQDMTNLTYGDNSFDIVFCSNAVDHSHDPYKALREMIRICKRGGWVYLRHIAHEGKRHNYTNLHQWNFDVMEDGDCIVWRKEKLSKNTFLLSDIYPCFKTLITVKTRCSVLSSFVQKK